MFPRFLASFALLFVLSLGAVAETPQLVRMFGRDQFPHQLVEGRDGALYGTTFGKIFRLTPAGAYRVLYDFGTYEPVPEVVAAEDGHLYGTTRFNGIHILFRLSYDGRFEVVHEFTSPGEVALDGIDLVIGPDGAVYGLTYQDSGGPPPIFFRCSLDGEYSVVADFTGTGFNLARSPIVGHDGAFRAMARRPSNYEAIARIGLDGVISDTTPTIHFPAETGRLFLHPDGTYYLPRWSSIFQVSQAGTLLPGLYSGYSDPGSALLGRDGSFYATSQRVLRPLGASVSEISRINATGTVAVATNFKAPFLVPRPLVQTHDGLLYGSGQRRSDEWSVFRLRIPNQTRVNLPPYARPDFARPPAPGQSQVIRVLANDRDVDRDALTITEVRGARLGAAALGSDGKSIVYTAPAGEPVAVDEFTYVIADGNGGRGIGRVSLRTDARGVFSGLLAEDEPRQDGHLSVQLSGYGALTGKLWLGGFLSHFAGELDGENRFHARIQTAAAASAEITLELQVNGTSMALLATILADGVPLELVLTKPNAQVARAKAGDYTFVIPAEAHWTGLPPVPFPFDGTIPHPLQKAQGDGYGRWTLARSGAAIVTGKLPDGEPFAASLTLDSSGRLPFFATLYPMPNTSPVPMRGWVRGMISFKDTPGVSDADGSLKWLRTVRGFSYYFAPVAHEVVALQASRYTAPESLQEEFPNGLRTEADGGGIQGTVDGLIQATENSLVASSSSRVNGKLNLGTGALSGHWSRPGSSVWTPWGGVLLQKQGAVRGQFRAFGWATPGLKPFGTGRLLMETP